MGGKKNDETRQSKCFNLQTISSNIFSHTKTNKTHGLNFQA